MVAVAVDARDPEALASFWAAALGTEIGERWRDAHGTPKNRVHLDLRAPAGTDQRAEGDRLVALGASLLDEAPDHPWIVLADPEGNEFCLLPPD